jgi:hypothetical protein
MNFQPFPKNTPWRFPRISGLWLVSTALILLISISGCQSYWVRTKYHIESKYSPKKRKSHSARLAPNGGYQFAQPLPMRLSQSAMASFLSEVEQLRGTRYRSGGCSPDGFDCSGLVCYLMKRHFGLLLPRSSADMATHGVMISSTSALQKGDLLFFSIDGRTIDHVGIVTGWNRFVHAATSGVREDYISSSYYRERFAFGARLLIAE